MSVAIRKLAPGNKTVSRAARGRREGWKGEGEREEQRVGSFRGQCQGSGSG